MSIPADIRYAIASLSHFVDNWVCRPCSADTITLRELHAARVVLTKARLALDTYDAPPPGFEFDPPQWCPPASLAHRLHARAEARHQSHATLPAPRRMPHP